MTGSACCSGSSPPLHAYLFQIAGMDSGVICWVIADLVTYILAMFTGRR
ncbi:DUF3104 domain-containing protein [Synechococcus sp. MIT S9503]